MPDIVAINNYFDSTASYSNILAFHLNYSDFNTDGVSMEIEMRFHWDFCQFLKIKNTCSFDITPKMRTNTNLLWCDISIMAFLSTPKLGWHESFLKLPGCPRLGIN